jgi:hypothetical protein
MQAFFNVLLDSEAYLQNCFYALQLDRLRPPNAN